MKTLPLVEQFACGLDAPICLTWEVNRRSAISSSSRRLVPGGRPRRPPATSAVLVVNTVASGTRLAYGTR